MQEPELRLKQMCNRKITKSGLLALQALILLLLYATPTNAQCPRGMWQIDANGYIGTLTVDEVSNHCRGLLRFDILPPEPPIPITVQNGIATFVRGDQRYSGMIHRQLMLGTFTDNSDIDYSWEARRTSSPSGLVELANNGDWNRDGTVDNKDVVDFIRNFGITFTTYRWCDDEYNPGCFGLLENHSRSDGLPKAVAVDRYADLGVAPTPFPPEQLPIIREIGKAILRHRVDFVAPAIAGWNIDFAGLPGKTVHVPGRLDHLIGLWSVNANNYSGLLLIWSNGPAGRVRFGDSAVEPLTNFSLISDPTFGGPPIEIRFRRRISRTVEQRYVGTFRGLRGNGILGNEIVGSFNDGAGNYDWTATGIVRDSGLSELSIVSNGYTGSLKLRLDGGVSGKIRFANASSWEPITDFGERFGNGVSFFRTNSNQRYVGTVSGDSMSGTVEFQRGSYSWNANRMTPNGGTTLPECRSLEAFEVGTVCRTIYYTGPIAQAVVHHELLSHSLEDALVRVRAPFVAADLIAYRAVGFRMPGCSCMPSQASNADCNCIPTRPGFISDYAAHDAMAGHDLVETIDHYALAPGKLWKLAHDDIAHNSSDLLWRKREFVRERIFSDVQINGIWNIVANGYSGSFNLSITSAPSRLALPLSTISFFGVPETIDQVQFNGATLRFHRREPGGTDQAYIGVLRGNWLSGLFTHGGQVYEWSASRTSP